MSSYIPSICCIMLTPHSDPQNGLYKCPADHPNGVYCAGNSLDTNIIIRCTNGVGQPGNCNDNLAGYFPLGVRDSQCYETAKDSGFGACMKNCIVQGSSGNINGTITLPDCTPDIDPSATSSMAQSTQGLNTSTTITSTSTTTYADSYTTTTRTFTTTYCPTSTGAYYPTASGGANGAGSPPSNGTAPYAPGSSGSPAPGAPGSGASGSSAPGAGSPGTPQGPATATPVGPSATGAGGPILSNNGVTNSAGAGLAAVGLLIAYFL